MKKKEIDGTHPARLGAAPAGLGDIFRLVNRYGVAHGSVALPQIQCTSSM